jgi:hypothetical protein
MNTKLIGFIALGLITMVLCGGVAFAGPAADDTVGGVTPVAPPEWEAGDVIMLIGKIVNWIFTVLMVVVVIMVLIAGYMFVTGGANPETTTKARNVLMYALIGFAVAMLSKGLIALVAAFLNKAVPVNPLMPAGGGTGGTVM